MRFSLAVHNQQLVCAFCPAFAAYLMYEIISKAEHEVQLCIPDYIYENINYKVYTSCNRFLLMCLFI